MDCSWDIKRINGYDITFINNGFLFHSPRRLSPWRCRRGSHGSVGPWEKSGYVTNETKGMSFFDMYIINIYIHINLNTYLYRTYIYIDTYTYTYIHRCVYSWTALRWPWRFVGLGWEVGWGMYSRSCELARREVWFIKWRISRQKAPSCFQASPTLPVPRRWAGPGSLWKISCQLTWFWSAKSVGIPLCTRPCDNMCSCGAGDEPWRIQVLKGSWKNLKRCCEHKTDETVWKPSSCGLWRIHKNAGFV